MEELVFMPLLVLIVGVFFGVASFRRALVFLVFWIVLCGSFALVWMNYSGDSFTALLGIVVAMFLAMPSIWLATLFTLETSTPVTPSPAEKIYSTYQILDDSEKEKVHEFVKIGLEFAAKHGAERLRNKGHHNAAAALDKALKLV